jgi:hypothetical protein
LGLCETALVQSRFSKVQSPTAKADPARPKGRALGGGFGDDEEAARDLSGQADARGADLDDTGLARLADPKQALVGEAEGAEQRAVIRGQLCAVEPGDRPGGELGQANRMSAGG